MIEPSQAVFVSYASQDQEAARRICEALREAGIEVWFDQSELRGGDVWDQKIRRQIHDCTLFVPVISANTASRREGYFRLEWDLADQRSHRMARDQAFIVPVSVDATPGAGTDAPESFHRVQWTRLPHGETPPEFVARIKRLLSPESPAAARLPTGPTSLTTSPPSPLKHALPAAIAVLVLAALTYLLINKPWISKPTVPAATSDATSSPALPAAFHPPPHSIAVLPFVNMSGDASQSYFSDGLTEELLNSLSRINELQVAARTSSFSFQGEHPDIATVAHKLNVAAVLEGSVRRSGHTIRITAQLNNAVTGFHLWSQTYDRDLSDVLKLQTEIANAVANALKVTLLGDVAEKIELGGTRNAQAFDAYLQASKALESSADAKDLERAIAGYSDAIRLDPNYALAFAYRSIAWTYHAQMTYGPHVGSATIRAEDERGLADAREAVTLAPQLAEGHLALHLYFWQRAFDFANAKAEIERAVALAPGNARVLGSYGRFTVLMGHAEAGLAAAHRAVLLDPLNEMAHYRLAQSLYLAHRFAEAVAVWNNLLVLDPQNDDAPVGRGWAYYGLGDFERAQASCEAKPDNDWGQWCLAIVYHRLARYADAEAEFSKIREAGRWPYRYAEVYAQWGNTSQALELLESAWRLRDPELPWMKADPGMDPLRNEPRFQAIERELKFPN